jgi:ubiquinone biosynthesis protein UbiJ
MQPPFIAILNHVLRQNSWARDRLMPHAGKSVRFESAPFSLALTVREDGGVAAAAQDAAPDATIRISPGTAMRVLLRDESAWAGVEVSGDTEFSQAIHQVWRHLRWDAEEDLARVFGDVAAHRMTQSAAALDQWRSQSFDNLARSFAEHWIEERPLIAGARDIAAFNREVDRLREDVARLEKRIERRWESVSRS